MAQEEREKYEIEELRNAFRTILGTRQGRKVLWFILDICNVYGDCFTGNSRTFYLEGRKSIGLELIDAIEDARPGTYARMLLKHYEDIAQEEKENE